MPEVANCPVCGEEPYQHGKDSYLKYGISCCGHTIWTRDNPSSWNRYAAAMEFSIAESWEEETDKVREWLDVSTDNADAYNEIVDININAERAVFAAREASNEVFK